MRGEEQGQVCGQAVPSAKAIEFWVRSRHRKTKAKAEGVACVQRKQDTLLSAEPLAVAVETKWSVSKSCG